MAIGPRASRTTRAELAPRHLVARIAPRCTDRWHGRTDPTARPGSRDADGLRAPRLERAVRDVDADGDLDRSAAVRARAERPPTARSTRDTAASAGCGLQAPYGRSSSPDRPRDRAGAADLRPVGPAQAGELAEAVSRIALQGHSKGGLPRLANPLSGKSGSAGPVWWGILARVAPSRSGRSRAAASARRRRTWTEPARRRRRAAAIPPRGRRPDRGRPRPGRRPRARRDRRRGHPGDRLSGRLDDLETRHQRPLAVDGPLHRPVSGGHRGVAGLGASTPPIRATKSWRTLARSAVRGSWMRAPVSPVARSRGPCCRGTGRQGFVPDGRAEAGRSVAPRHTVTRLGGRER